MKYIKVIQLIIEALADGKITKNEAIEIIQEILK